MRTLVLAAAVLLLTAGMSRADATFSDHEFAVADWLSSMPVATLGATQSTSRVTVGGNPDAYRYTVHVLPGNASITVAHVYQPGSYDPAVDGPIFTVDYDEDRFFDQPPFPGSFIEARPLLQQGGVLYYGPDITFSNTAWGTELRNNLVALDFTSATNTHPDFGPGGGIIHFGYARSSFNPNTLQANFRNAIDNWSVTVHSGVLAVEPLAKLEVLRVLGPNPFRSSVAFRLDMSQAGTARVSLHDASGRLVRTLANGTLSAGTHPMSWDGNDDAGRALPAGLYFVAADAAGTHAAGRVVKLN